MKGDEALRAGDNPETTDGEKTVGKVSDPQRQRGSEEPSAPMTMSSTPSDTSAAPPLADPPPAPADPPADPPADAPKPPPARRPALPDDYVKLVYSPKIQENIAKRLVRAGIPEEDRREMHQDINKALLFMSDRPADQEACEKAANDIITKTIAGVRRQNFRRGERGYAGPTDEADNHAADEARELANGHHAQKLAVLREALDDGTMSERDAQMLTLKRAGHTDAQIAEKLGMAKQTVSNRIAIVRTRMRDKWAKRMATLTALTLTVVVLIIVGWRKREEVARFFHLESPAPAPTAPAPTRPQPEPSIPVALREAAKLRSEALEACNSGQYATCSDRLEAAAKLDPAGDRDPLMRRMRHDIEDHIRPENHQVGAKPGGL